METRRQIKRMDALPLLKAAVLFVALSSYVLVFTTIGSQLIICLI